MTMKTFRELREGYSSDENQMRLKRKMGLKPSDEDIKSGEEKLEIARKKIAKIKTLMNELKSQDSK